MVPPVHHSRLRRLPAVLLMLLSITFFPACEPADRVDLRPELEKVKAELDQTKRRLNGTSHQFTLKTDELSEVMINLQAAQKRLKELEEKAPQQDALLQSVQAELAALKKSDTLAFSEILAIQQTQPTVAAGRYQKFIENFPKSPLVVHATTAIAQLTTTQRVEARKIAEIIDPKRREREFQKTFNEGYMTLQELAPVLKKKLLTQVLALLGQPNQTFNDKTELGYEDRAINPATGTRGMLIITFENGVVAALRVEYGGRKITP